MKKTTFTSVLISVAMLLTLSGCAQETNTVAEITTSEEQPVNTEKNSETVNSLILSENPSESSEFTTTAAVTTTVPSESAATVEEITTTIQQSSASAEETTTTTAPITTASPQFAAAPHTAISTQQTTTSQNTTVITQATTTTQQTTATETTTTQSSETVTESTMKTRGGKDNSVDFGSFGEMNSATAISSDTTLSVSLGSSVLDTSDMFSNRDLKQTVDTSEAQTITVAEGKTITITEEGIYVITGSAKNCTIIVNTDKSFKVQLVLDGVSITNDNFPAIYVVSADKCFVTTTDSTNTLSVTGQFRTDGDTNTDAVIFSKDDIVLNGVGTLNITSAYANGISGKDDIKITGGTYNITTAKDSIEANDSIRICGGTFTINSKKDALHCENDDDSSVGWIYISDGEFDITASSDGIQATTILQIDGGTLKVKASEGFEASYVQINGGKIAISASDDGINASKKSTAITTPTVEINGGEITITMGQGDTDGIDANGNIYVNGGTVNVTGQSTFDYDGVRQLNGGTVIVNGQQVTALPQSMMGGGQGGFGGQVGFGGKGGFGDRRGFGVNA